MTALAKQIDAIQFHAARARLLMIEGRHSPELVVEEMEAIIAEAQRVCRVVEAQR